MIDGLLNLTTHFYETNFNNFLASWYSLFEFQLASIKCWVVFPIISLFVYTPQFSTVVFGFKHVQLRKIFDLRKFSLFPKWKNNLHNVWFKQDFQFKQEICSSWHLAWFEKLLYYIFTIVIHKLYNMNLICGDSKVLKV